MPTLDLKKQLNADDEASARKIRRVDMTSIRSPRSIFVWLLGALLPVMAIGQVDVDWDNVVLHSGGQTLRPVAAPNPPLWGKRFAEGWLDFSEDNLIQVRADTGEVLRRIELSDKRVVATTADDRVIAAYHKPVAGGGAQLVGWISEPGMIGPGTLRTLLPAEDTGWELLGAASVSGHEAFLLGLPRKEKRRSYERVRLKVFAGTADQPVLSWEQPVGEGEISLPGVFLRAANGPRPVSSDLLPVVACGDFLLVSPGPQEPIYCIDPQKPGAPVVWKLEKPWEFRRGFTGPSVWSHHLARFGVDHMSVGRGETMDWTSFVDDVTHGVSPEFKEQHRKAAEAEMAELKLAEADLMKRCQMIGGPFVVKAEGVRSGRIFVAVAEAESAGPWARQLTHTIVYEVEAETGKPVALIRLPRNTIGSAARVRDGGVDWRCEKHGLARLEPSDNGGSDWGPGGPDCVGRLRWYHEAIPERRDAWLSSPATRSAWVWTDKGILAALDDSWIENKVDRLMHFPIREIGRGEQGESYELLVPLLAPLPQPQSNYSSSGGKFRTMGPYMLGVTGLERHDGRLYVTLGYDSGYRTLVFEGVGASQ